MARNEGRPIYCPDLGPAIKLYDRPNRKAALSGIRSTCEPIFDSRSYELKARSSVLQISRKRTVNSLSLSLYVCVRTLASSAIFSWLRRSLSCLPLDTSSSDRSRAKIRAIDISFHTPIRYTWLSRLILRFSPIFQPFSSSSPLGVDRYG